MPKTRDFDVVILGSGFGGSLLAQIARRLDFRVALVDRAHHPRFAIGESSTPAADLILASLARRYDLRALQPLTRYGSWKQHYPHLVCGPKRGFSYFAHRPQEQFEVRNDHANELLVAASQDDQNCDINWYRADVDQFFAEQAREAGVEVWEDTCLEAIEGRDPWRFRLVRGAETWQVGAPLAVDATGTAGALLRLLHIDDATERLRTRSAAVYSHFENVPHWSQLLAELRADVGLYPFAPDKSALHHILDGGWMWNLRFDNDLLSAGFCVIEGSEAYQALGRRPPAAWFQEHISRYPGLTWLFQDARVADIPGRIELVPRLQRCAARASGRDWVALPHTVGFVDPLHSTGIAHTLSGVERVARMLSHHWQRPTWNEQLQAYQSTVFRELEFIDQIVHGCYLAMENFERFVDFSMTYFAAATSWEKRRLESPDDDQGALFCADDAALRCAVGGLYHTVLRNPHDSQKTDLGAFRERTRELLAPFNHAGLCDPTVMNMYRYTAVELPAELPADL